MRSSPVTNCRSPPGPAIGVGPTDAPPAWLATAHLRASEGERGGAKRAAVAGLRILADHQQTLGATELRVGATAHAERLARLGLRLALEDRRPREVFRWAERVRANALAMPTVRPPADSPLAAALVELRQRRSAFDEARARGGSFDGGLEADVRRQESVVRDLARLVGGAIDGAGQPSIAHDDLQDRLGAGRRLVEFIEADGVIHAVVVSDRRYRLHVGLAAATDLLGLVDQVGFGLGRLARRSSSAASQAASLASLTDALAQLDDALLRPLRVDGDELVIVPTGVLHNLPWGGLPSLTEQPHSIASSATRWTPPVGLPVRPQVVVIAGPRLDDGPGEVDAVRSTFTGAKTLVGSDTTVAAALDLLATADIAHVACHGHFRSDSPMFSSLELVDGPLTVYDLESLGAPPRRRAPRVQRRNRRRQRGRRTDRYGERPVGDRGRPRRRAGDDRQRPRHGRRDAIVPPPPPRRGGSGRGARPHADGGQRVRHPPPSAAMSLLCLEYPSVHSGPVPG